MTSRDRDRARDSDRDWHGDRRAVFDRDDHTCRRCGTTERGDGGTDTETHADGDADAGAEPAALRLYPVGDVPLEGRIHDSALATVCERCFAALRADPAPADSVRPDGDELFALARDLTRQQGATVSAVASFASLSTSLPADLEAAEDDADARTDAESAYVRARREVLLAIDVVPTRLERLAAVDETTLEPAVADALGTLVDAGRRLQSQLREIVARCEAVAAGLGRCHGCLEPYEAPERTGDVDPATATDPCPSCRIERRDVTEWRAESDSNAAGEDSDAAADAVSFGALFTAINDALQDASATTEELTDRAATLAEALQDDTAPA